MKACRRQQGVGYTWSKAPLIPVITNPPVFVTAAWSIKPRLDTPPRCSFTHYCIRMGGAKLQWNNLGGIKLRLTP